MGRDQNTRWLLRNGRIVHNGAVTIQNIAVSDGKIADIGPDISVAFDKELDLNGKMVIPGLIDPHVHFELPVGNRTSADDFLKGGIAALYGGVTTVLDFTTPFPGMSLPDSLAERLQRASVCPADYSLHVTVCGWNEKRKQEVAGCIQQGASSFKFFTAYEESNRRTSYEDLRSAAEVIKSAGGLVTIHSEDQHQLKPPAPGGSDSFLFYESSRPPVSEATAISRLAAIQSETGADMYIVHLSSQEGYQSATDTELLLETCPHYLILDKSRYDEPWGYRYAVAPPLRDTKDRNTLWEGLLSGRIQTIGTDHCPFPQTLQDTAGDHFTKAPFGLAGVETLLPLLVTYGIETGKLTWPQLVNLTSENPAKIFSLYPRKGSLQPGADADLVVINTDFRVIEPSALHTQSTWNPYSGLLLTGFPDLVFSRGELVISQNTFLGKAGRGLFLPRPPTHNRYPIIR